MKRDEEAIGGFFEDLPVLMFVLIGTLLVIETSVWVTDQRGALDRARTLDEAAEKLADKALSTLSNGGLEGITLDSVRVLNQSSLDFSSEEAAAWTVVVSIIHPWQETVVALHHGEALPMTEAGWHCRLFNVSHCVSGTAVAEVVVVVFAEGA